MTQPPLFSAADFPALVEATDAEAFHAANPHVMAAVVKMATYAQQHGVRRYGIKAIFEALRWSALETTGEVYKLNNNYTAWYARAVGRLHPTLAPLFLTRSSAFDADFERTV